MGGLVAWLCFAGGLAGGWLLFPPLIRRLTRWRAGQVIQAELPTSHQVKSGTPTAGGLCFVALAVVAGAAGLAFGQAGAAGPTLALVLGATLGFADDLVKLRQGWLGIPARLKFPLQVLVAIPVAILARPAGPQFLIPLQAWWQYLPLAVLAIVGTANAVNLTDGMDGLAATLAIIACAALAFLTPGAAPGERYLAATLCGGLVAFLLFNRYPARLFMGDTGSLALGYGLAAMAIEERVLFLLPLLGLVFVLETLSVIIQVAYFKATGGRRIFKMTPIHYTFHLQGWSENRIVLSFGTLGLVTALAAAWVARVW